ncbi:MAG: cardiolipin synthase [Roseburia sp.]
MRTEESKQQIKNSVGRAVVVALSVLLQVIWIVALALKLTEYYAAISTIASLLALLVALRIYGEQINSAYKLSWIILILVFPVLGLCLFLIFGNESSIVFIKKYFESKQFDLKEILPENPAAAEQLRERNLGIYNQTRYLRDVCGYPLYDQTDVVYYGDTVEALEAQKEALRGATHFIFMEYHAIEDTEPWREIEDILSAKVKEGVDVRVVYDDMGSIGFLSKPFARRLQSKGIQCRVFNPLVPVMNVFMNNRDHRKITVVDGKVGFTGGYNLADEYFNITHPYGQWKDSGIRLTGKAVNSFTVIFLEMWNSTQKTVEDPTPFLVDYDYVARENCFVQPYADTPMDKEYTGENVYLNLIKNARKSVYITTPYLIIDDEMQRELILAAGRGVDVRIVTPGIPDKKIVFKATRSYYPALVGRGVRIFEYTPGFIHSKQFLCDGEVAAVGTINMDFRSLYLHFENGCIFYGGQAVRDVEKDFDELFAVSEEVTERYKEKQNFVLRGLQCILHLFGPLM